MGQAVDTRGWADAEPLEVPDEITGRVARICDKLPDAERDGSAFGPRWRIRKRTFLTVRTRSLVGVAVTRLQFRAADDEYQFLVQAGWPYSRAGWGHHVVNMFLDAATDWAEAAELITESYCVMAPKRLAAAAREAVTG